LAPRQSSTYSRSVQRAAGTLPGASPAVAQFERGLISERIEDAKRNLRPADKPGVLARDAA